MKGFRLGSIFGFEISVDLSWFLIFFLVLWSLTASLFPANEPILTDAYRAELEIYGKENQFVHAIALKIYQGNKLSHQMLP